MSQIKKYICLIFLIIPLVVWSQQQQQLASRIEGFMTKNNPGLNADSTLIIKDQYKYFVLYKIGIGKRTKYIYLINWLTDHRRSYLLVTDKAGNRWDFFGHETRLDKDLLTLKKIFSTIPITKKEKIRCYDLLIDNYYFPYVVKMN